MLLVGLTGGIGAGKSTVSALLAEHGAVVVDADQVARDLQAAGSPMLDRMAERFGDHILRSDGSLDRAAVAAIVFGDSPDAKQALADLNGIVHPAMQDEIRRQVEAQRPGEGVAGGGAAVDHAILREIEPDLDAVGAQVGLDRAGRIQDVEVDAVGAIHDDREVEALAPDPLGDPHLVRARE